MDWKANHHRYFVLLVVLLARNSSGKLGKNDHASQLGVMIKQKREAGDPQQEIIDPA